MKEKIYLFKDGSSSTDVFDNLYQKMNREFKCFKLIDDDEDISDKINSLIGERVVLITTDHFSTGFTMDRIISILNPIKKYYSLHDLGIHTRSEIEMQDWNLLLPTMKWDYFFKDLPNKKIPIGYPKYYKSEVEVKYETIFFPSLIYIYKDRDYSSFYKDYKYIFDNNIPIKFPAYSGSYVLIEKLKRAGIKMNLLDTESSSFDLLFKCNNAITNSNSSIAVEAVIAGANSINIGGEYEPAEFYKEFKINMVNPYTAGSTDGVNNINFMLGDYIIDSRNSPMEEYEFKIEECIHEITSDEL